MAVKCKLPNAITSIYVCIPVTCVHIWVKFESATTGILANMTGTHTKPMIISNSIGSVLAKPDQLVIIKAN